MKTFAYVNPANEKDAVAALLPEFEKSLPIGGGQDLLARMKDYITEPDRIVTKVGVGVTRNPSKIEVVMSESGDQTVVRLNGSIWGVGPLQKGHLTSEMKRLRDAIELCAQG